MLQRLGVSLLLLLAVIFALQLPDKANGSDVCPNITVSGAQSGATGAQFVADVSGTDVDVTYNWSISAGTISEGQGTPVISVVDVGAAGSTVTATVELGGLAAECSISNSATVEIVAPDVQ